MEPAFLTLFVPAGIILFINVLLFLRICCLLSLSSSRHESVSRCDDPDTDETHDNNEIEVLAPRRDVSRQGPHGTRWSRSDSISSDQASSILDPVYRPSRQLYALVTLLVLFCLMWISGACVVTPPIIFLYCDVVYQCLYAATAVSFGLFVVVYYCIGRPEVRSLSCSCCRRRKRQKVSTQVETNDFQKAATNGTVVQNDDVCQMEHVVIVHSSHLAESSVASVADLVSLAAKSVCSECDHSQKQSQCPIPSLSATTSISPPVAVAASIPDYAMFYNQRQNGVARKYWERAKKKRAVAQRFHVPPHEIDLELTSNGNCVRVNGEVQRRPLLENDASVNYQTAVNGNHTRNTTEQQPLIHLPTSLNSETNCDIDIPFDQDVNTSSLKLLQNGLVELNSSSLDSRVDTLRNIKLVTVNGHIPSEAANNSSKKAQGENKVDCFIEQLEMRIPDGKPKKLISVRSDHRDAGQEGMLAEHCSDSNNAMEKSRRESDDSCVGDSQTSGAYAFINKNYNATSQSAHKTDFDSFDGALLKEQVSEPAQTQRSSLSEFSSSDIWIMQDANGVKSKTETSV